MPARYRPGQWVVYRKTKHSPSPGPRAQQVQPTASGDDYLYLVDKYWIVDAVADDGQLVLVTRTGKRHRVPPEDVSLRPAGLWTRFTRRERFRAIERYLEQEDAAAEQTESAAADVAEAVSER